MGYCGFWLVVLTGIFLTRNFSDVNLEETLLVEVFGYNNICVYFDFPPSTYVLPLLWAVTLVALLAYIAAHWLQMRAEVQEGMLTRTVYNVLTSLKSFEAFTLISFSTIFAVHPMGWDHTLYIHTAPFFLLQLGLVSLAMSNTLHGIKSTYWQRLGLPSWFSRAAIIYCIVFALVVAFKIPYATNAMAGYPWWQQTDSLKNLAGRVDQAFLVCAAIVPMAKAAYLLFFKSDRLHAVHLTPSLGPRPLNAIERAERPGCLVYHVQSPPLRASARGGASLPIPTVPGAVFWRNRLPATGGRDHARDHLHPERSDHYRRLRRGHALPRAAARGMRHHFAQGRLRAPGLLRLLQDHGRRPCRRCRACASPSRWRGARW